MVRRTHDEVITNGKRPVLVHKAAFIAKNGKPCRITSALCEFMHPAADTSRLLATRAGTTPKRSPSAAHEDQRTNAGTMATEFPSKSPFPKHHPIALILCWTAIFWLIGSARNPPALRDFLLGTIRHSSQTFAPCRLRRCLPQAGQVGLRTFTQQPHGETETPEC
jgi:hypothetical protein